MKIYLCISFMGLFLISRSQVSVQGLVSDSTNTPIPFAAIGLFSLQDSVLVKGTISNEYGKYTFSPLKSGKYVIKTNSIGYSEKKDNIVIDSSDRGNLFLDIKLVNNTNILDEITVRIAKKVVEFKNGNTIVDIENSPLAKGNSVYEVLIKLPSVSEENNNIIINGKSGVIVMIDGRVQILSGNSLINLLKSMNADLIKTIEILKNPPVKYDASGTSGMINIITKKVNVFGTTGTIFSSYSQGFYERALCGGSFNYKGDKIIFYSSLTASFGHYRRVEDFNKKFDSDTLTMNLIGNNVVKNSEVNFDYKLGLDWALSKKNVLGIKIEGGPGSDLSNGSLVNRISGYNNLGFNYLIAKIDQPDTWNSYNIDLNFSHVIDSMGSVFTIILDYTKLTESILSYNSNRFFNSNNIEVLNANNYRSKNKSNTDLITSKIDFFKVLNESSSLELGAKASKTKTHNDYLFERELVPNSNFIKDSLLSNNFEYNELTFAGYINYKKTFNTLDVILGGRVENTEISSNNSDKNFFIRRNYINFFPNLTFDYQRNKLHDFQLNLTRRIDRPNFSDLSPFSFYNDQYSLRQGNPFLLPNYANRIDFTYNYKNTVSTSFAYSKIQDIILSYTKQDDSSRITIQSIKNMKSSNRIEYSIFYNKLIFKKYDLTVNGTIARVDYSGDIEGQNFKQTGIIYYGGISNVFLLGKKSKLQINGRYLGPNLVGIFKIKPRWIASIAMSSTLLHDKLDLTLAFEDIFYTFIVRTQTEFENQNWTFKRVDDTRRVRVSLNYKFGKAKIKSKNLDKSNEEEIERLNH